MHPVRFAFVAAMLALAASAVPAPARAEPPPSDFNGFATFFRKEMESDKPEARMKAVRRATEILDARVPELLFDAEAKESVRRQGIEKQRVETEAALELVLGEIEKLQEQSPKAPKEVDAFNRRAKKVEAKRDEATSKLRDLAVDAVQGDAVLSNIVGAIGAVVDKLPSTVTEGALALALERWANPKMPVERRVRYVDLLASITKCPTGERLRAIVRDPAEDQRLRAVALTARIARGDEGILDDAVALLASAPGPLLSATVDGLRRIHKLECIEPLIAFLAREDLGRLRTDAQRALASLTGERHGPYRQPWADWWKDAKAHFTMPAHPADIADLTKPDKGVTFYGVTTFSDKILFVLDVSGSMKDIAHADAYGARGEERKIDIARREVVSALSMLDDKKMFNIVFFGHRLVRLQSGMVAAERATIDRAKRFVNEFEPSGGTNIHDALETAFQMAGSNVDGKNYLSSIDTIFFLTDGTPTAGKLVKPDEILAAVRGWNRLAQITVHCIGVGDECDVKFLEQMAKESGGTFVHR